MTSEELRALFRQCVTVLLDTASASGERRDAVQRLYKALSGAVGLEDEAIGVAENESTFLPLGKAVSVRIAARCLWEHERTARFLRGVEAAVREAQRRFPGQRIRLLEAGCGPFGLLALPLALRFSAAELGFVLLDYHARSLEMVTTLVQQLGLEEYILETVQADATRWHCPQSLRPHVMVSETMKEALLDEPQVAIVRNLAPQLMPDGILLPESIRVDACLYHQRNPLDADTRSWVDLGQLINLNAESAAAPFPLQQITIPEAAPESHALVERTRIQVFGDIHLDHEDCSLTRNNPVREMRRPQGGERLEVQYALEPTPGFQWRVVG